jgi:predicted unusual protein kinase regulating ubiquinone biosynthesis (AarF/ABC1/UbiB family)
VKEIPKIVENSFLRKVKILKLAAGSAHSYFKNKKDDLEEKIQKVLEDQSEQLVLQLGMMKGPLMKMGQILSLYGDHLLSPEFKKILSKIEDQSFYLNFDTLKKEIPSSLFDVLEIDSKPLAAASLGQVHRAKLKSNSSDLVLKIQYPKVKKAIDNDLSTLRLIMKLSKFIPQEIDTEALFAEIKTMLLQEANYHHELKMMENFSNHLKLESHYSMATTYPDLSSEKILVTSFCEGEKLRDFVGTADQRNDLGKSFLELLFKELFSWGIMQTDAHPGNYLIHESKWVLLDFGASKIISPKIQALYKNFMKAVIKNDKQLFLDTLYGQGYLVKDSKFNQELFTEYFETICTPFKGGAYDWGSSTIPEKILKLIPQMMKEFSLHQPPVDTLFIDRKIGGVYFILKMLGSSFDSRSVLEPYVRD